MKKFISCHQNKHSVYALSVSITVGNRMSPDGPNEGTTYRLIDKRDDELSGEKYPWDVSLTPKSVVLRRENSITRM